MHCVFDRMCYKDKFVIIHDYDQPMEGYLILYAPPIRKSAFSKKEISAAAKGALQLRGMVYAMLARRGFVAGPGFSSMKDMHHRHTI